jgi:hypothetical protein
MQNRLFTLPELAFIAGTRGMLGAGIGLLLSGKMTESQRRSVGLTLLTVGVVTTIPAAMAIFGSGRRAMIEAAH